MSERWHSVEEVATHLGVVEDTVRRWIQSRHLPAHRIGKLWKFHLPEVDAWVRAGGTHEPATPQPRSARRRATAR